jgi:hypothetical protein
MRPNAMPDLPLPVEFRAEVLGPAVALLRAGESCALVGVGSSGKSNVARHLARADVRLRYLAEAAPHTLVLYLNCKPFAGRAPHDLYLHALDKLQVALSEMGGGLAAVEPEVDRLWQEAQENPEVLARRNLDRAVGRAEQAGAQHVMFILDDCDDLFTQAPPVFFSELRALRDNHKVRLVYLTLTRREPAFLRPDAKEYEELFELLSAPGHTLPVPPYTEADSATMIRRLAARQSPPREMSAEAVRKLTAWSGGHAGLIRSLFFAARNDQGFDEAASLEQLLSVADVGDECGKVWDSLESDEQAALAAFAAGGAAPEDDLRRLQRRGLLRRDESGQRSLFCPVFADFTAGLAGGATSGAAQFDFPADGSARLNGRPILGLSPAEVALLQRLAQARPDGCSRAQLLEAMRVGEGAGRAGRVSGDPLRRLNHYILHLQSRLSASGVGIQPAGDGYRLEVSH